MDYNEKEIVYILILGTHECCLQWAEDLVDNHVRGLRQGSDPGLALYSGCSHVDERRKR